jgi:hypothetical protein
MTRPAALLLALCLAACAPLAPTGSVMSRLAPSSAAAAASGVQKPVFDAMVFDGQPDRRGVGMVPLYVCYDGVLNRATIPEADNASPGGADTSEFAIRRVARDALRLEHPGIPQARWDRPAVYDSVPQAVCLDLEGAGLMGRLYSERVDDPDRRAAAKWLAGLVAAGKAEAAGYGQTVNFGAYSPLWPYANDPAAKAAAEADWKPYLDALDAGYPDCYIHGPDLEKWKADVRARIDLTKRLLPGRPVYPFLCPLYSWGAPADLRNTFVPLPLWKEAVAWVLAQDDVAGVVIWAGADLANPGPGGANRLPWTQGAPYAKAVTDAAKRVVFGKPRDGVEGGGH